MSAAPFYLSGEVTVEKADTIYKKALAKFGNEAQFRQTQEECAELIAALNQFLRGRAFETTVLDEIADVRIMLDQLEMIFGKNICSAVYQKKMARLQDNLKTSQSAT